MTMGVVHRFEAIQINVQNSQIRLVTAAQRQLPFHKNMEHGTVRQAGQNIVMRLILGPTQAVSCIQEGLAQSVRFGETQERNGHCFTGT